MTKFYENCKEKIAYTKNKKKGNTLRAHNHNILWKISEWKKKTLRAIKDGEMWRYMIANFLKCQDPYKK